MPLYSDAEGPVPKSAAEVTGDVVLAAMVESARAGQVVHLTGPADGDAVAVVVPVDVAWAAMDGRPVPLPTVPDHAASTTAGLVLADLISAAKRGEVTILDDPDSGQAVAAVMPASLATAGLKALGRSDE